jgi:heat shock protein HtpX
MKNVTRAWIFLLALSIGLTYVGSLVAGRGGLLFMLTLALAINCFVYFYEPQRVRNLFTGLELEGQDGYGILTLLKNLCTKTRMPIPTIVVVENESPQALALGRDMHHGTIVITSGLFKYFTPREIEVVLACQLAALKTLNTLAFSAASFFCTTLLFVTNLLDGFVRLIIVEKKNPDQMISQPFTQMAAPILGLLMRLSLPSHFYFQADELAGKMIGDPHLIAEVLWKFESFAHRIPFAAPIPVAHSFIVTPLTKVKWTRYFQVQPQISKRIFRLTGHFPI